MAFLPRAADLQEAAVKRIDDFLQVLADRKASYVRASDEDSANQVLALELALRAFRAELGMWLKVKRDDADRAWDDLVTAQQLLAAAIAIWQQVGADPTGLENLLRRLLSVEAWVFPPQIFNSIGGTVSLRECSICAGDYDDCDHIRGRAYMGRICQTIVKDLRLKEASIVAEPADKRCRVTHFGDRGKMRNRMTWRLEDRPEPAKHHV